MRSTRILERKLQRQREGRLPEEELWDLLREIGDTELVNSPSIQDELVSFLDHPNAIVRHNALGALAYHGLDFDWYCVPGVSLKRRALQMLASDEDDDCRRQAAAALGTMFRCSGDPLVLETLRLIVSNRAEAEDLRAFAYVAALTIMGVPLSDQPNPVALTAHELDQMIM